MTERLDGAALYIFTADEAVFHRIREMEQMPEQGRQADDWPWYAQRMQSASEFGGLPVGSLVMIDNAHPLRPDWSDARWRGWAAHISIIVLSSAPNDAEGISAMNAGAAGYCNAYANAATLKQVVEVVASGELWVGRSLLTRLLKGVNHGLAQRTGNAASPATAWHRALTEREIEIARMAAQGASNLGIADVMGITERTVKAHLSSIFDKLGVADRLQLALKVHGVK